MEQKWNENENENKKWIKEMKTVLFHYFDLFTFCLILLCKEYYF